MNQYIGSLLTLGLVGDKCIITSLHSHQRRRRSTLKVQFSNKCMSKNKQPNPESKSQADQLVSLTLCKGKKQLPISLNDLFIGSEGKPLPLRELWSALSDRGIYINPLLEQTSIQSSVCIWCGGPVIRYTGVDESNYEIRCSDCQYMYEEE